MASITQPVSFFSRFADASRLGGRQEFDLAPLSIHDCAGICAAFVRIRQHSDQFVRKYQHVAERIAGILRIEDKLTVGNAKGVDQHGPQFVKASWPVSAAVQQLSVERVECRRLVFDPKPFPQRGDGP